MLRLEYLREKAGLTQIELAQKLNMTQQRISAYEKGKREPDIETIKQFANFFGVSTDYLLGKDEKEEKIYNLLPVVGKVSAGQPILADENIIEYIKVSPEVYGIDNPDDYFYLVINGESMNLAIHNGEYALIHKQNYAETGDIVVAIVNDEQEAVIKEYKKISDEIVALQPQSTFPFEPIYIDLKKDKLTIIGKAISHFGKL